MLEKSELVSALASPYGASTPAARKRPLEPATEGPPCQLRFQHYGAKTPPEFEQATHLRQDACMGSNFLSFSTGDDERRVRRLSCSPTGVWSCKRADMDGEAFGSVCRDLTYSERKPPMCRHIVEMMNGKQGTFAYKVGLPTTWTSAPPSAPPGAAATTTTTTETTTETHNDAHASLANFGLPAADAAADGDGASADDDATTISGSW